MECSRVVTQDVHVRSFCAEIVHKLDVVICTKGRVLKNMGGYVQIRVGTN